ncbi:MAG TPA: hypothetical protein VK508_13005 [Cyclobacteriaceae bacterium]|nr:hypothetical protein [Cyclobacteriaceae bacterium]
MIGPQPSVELLGIRIDEPMTTATDVLVSAVCFYAFYQLTKRKIPGRTHLYFRFYFLLMSIATGIGGVIGHGFLYALSFPWKLPGWIVSMLSVALIERSSIERAKPLIDLRLARFLMVLNIIELLTIMTVTMSSLNFKWVEFHSGYGLLGVVLPFHAYTWYKTRDKGSLVIIMAVLVASLAALVFMNKISIHTWFNYLDISHVMMAIGAYVFYRGALLLEPRVS